jgi:hypothetical protein
MKRELRVGAVVAALFFPVLVTWDAHTPARIEWRPALLEGQTVDRAPGLVVQHQDGPDIWATQGYSIYRSQGESFEKVITIRPRFGLPWLGYSKLLRRWTGHSELAEVLPISNEVLVVFAGGDVYRVDLGSRSQIRVHTLRYYGLSEGRGAMPHGLTLDDTGAIYYGEYTTLRNSSSGVRMYRSDDEGRTWTVAYEFPAGKIRHIHAVQWDPVGKAVWVGTGDSDLESRIGRSTSQGDEFEWIGSDSQLFRAASLLFFDDSVVWAVDSFEKESMRALSWSRTDKAVQVAEYEIPAPAYYGLRLDGRTGIVTLGETELSVWSINSNLESRKIFEWPVANRSRGPHPVVRLPRSDAGTVRMIYLNPLRSAQEEAAIYRLPIRLLKY